MQMKNTVPWLLAGFCAGAVTGLFGAGGGMVLVPLMGLMKQIQEEEVFPTSVAVILPVCLVCLLIAAASAPLPWKEALPYLAGSCVGGVLSGLLGKKLPVLWLHRILGAFILWGGMRYLC